MESEKDNLINGLLDQINRVKEMIPIYQALPKGAGMLASKFMEAEIKKAEKAISEGDTIQMIYSFNKLNEYKI
jgi:hypothetical protein